MEDPTEQSSVVGENLEAPVQLSPDQEKLCRRLDDLYANSGFDIKPSDMFRGAIFVSRNRGKNNPDWIAQAANSLREITYQFKGKDGIPNKEIALEKYGSVHARKPRFASELGKIHDEATELAHHGNGNNGKIDYGNYRRIDFEKLLARFELVMTELLRRQVDIHHEIDDLLNEDPETDLEEEKS